MKINLIYIVNMYIRFTYLRKIKDHTYNIYNNVLLYTYEILKGVAMSKYWNNTVNNIEPYVPGEQPQDKKYIKLNTNENPYPPSEKVISAMKDAVNGDLKLYPDPICKELISEIASFYNLSKDEVFVGNGSDEVLAFAFMTYFSKERKILFPDISYSFYPVYANFFNLDYELVPLDDNYDIPAEELFKENGGVILPNPNAPTAKYIETGKLKELLDHNKDSVVIIDEAYIDFGGESMVKYIKDYPNLLVIQTLSKSRSLAGLRGGLALGNAELIEGLNRVKNSINSYTLDRISLAGAVAAFKDVEYFELTRNKIIKTRENTVEQMKKLGFNVLDTKANFMFAAHNNIPGKYLYDALKDNGILVRHFNKPRIDNFLRISIGTDEEMETLVSVLKNIIKEYK
jgi:histidinol-phosphate aminotransferase